MRILITLALCFGVIFPCLSAEIARTSPIQELLQFLQATQSAQGTFTQKVTDRQGKVKQTARGTFILKRPNQFRWQYQSPHQQLIVSDGQQIQVYDPDLNQVTIKPVDQTFSGTPAAVLTGNTSLDAAFKLTVLPEQNGFQWVEAIPKAEETGMQGLQFGLQAKQIKQLRLTDAFGQVTTIELNQWTQNPPLAADSFFYRPPAGADVLRESPQSNQTRR